MTVRTNNGCIRVVHLRRSKRRRPRRAQNGLCMTITTDERLALHCGFVARRTFDHASIEGARIASSAGRRKVVLLEALGDDRRSDDSSTRRMH